MTNCLIIVCALLGSVSALLPRVRAGDAPGYSDIAKIGPDSFLAVNDRKRSAVEGMAVITKGDTIFLIHAERGGKLAGGQHQTGTLVWGKLDLGTYTFSPLNEAALVASSVFNDRDCSALHLVASAGQPGRYRVMSVATSDPSDTDVGPFTSILFHAGTLEINSAGDGLLYTPASEQEQHRLTVASIKVEGLTAPADAIAESTFTLASDDEDYGGIVRPVRWSVENKKP